MNPFSGFYDWLYETAESCIESVGYESLRDQKNIFIISVIEEARLKTFLDGLLQINPTVKITILTQDYVVDGFRKNFGRRGKVISWKGGYTTKVVELAEGESIDSFVFFSDFPMNLRDQNYLAIAEAFDSKNKTDTFCCTIGNDIYHYKNMQTYKRALKVYEETASLIDCYLCSAGKGREYVENWDFITE